MGLLRFWSRARTPRPQYSRKMAQDLWKLKLYGGVANKRSKDSRDIRAADPVMHGYTRNRRRTEMEYKVSLGRVHGMSRMGSMFIK